MASKATTKTAKPKASLNGNLNGERVQGKARPSGKRQPKPESASKKTVRVPTREVILEDGTVGILSLYKAQRGRKRFTKEERERIALWEAIFTAMEEQEQAAS